MEEIVQDLSDNIIEIFMKSYDYVNIFDEKGNILKVNKKMVEKLGYSEEELLKMNLSNLIIDIDYSKMKENIRKTIMGALYLNTRNTQLMS